MFATPSPVCPPPDGVCMQEVSQAAMEAATDLLIYSLGGFVLKQAVEYLRDRAQHNKRSSEEVGAMLSKQMCSMLAAAQRVHTTWRSRIWGFAGNVLLPKRPPNCCAGAV